MLKRENGIKKFNRAQSIAEYSTVLLLVLSIFVTMNVFVKRGAQGLIRMVADEVGNQQRGDQVFNVAGHVLESYAVSRGRTDRETREGLDGQGVLNYVSRDSSVVTANAHFNLGTGPLTR